MDVVLRGDQAEMSMRWNALSTGTSQVDQPEQPEQRAGKGLRFLHSAFRWALGFTLVVALLQLAIVWVSEPVALFSSAPFLFDFSYYYVAALTLRLNPHANIYDPRVMPAVAHAHRLFIGKGAGTFNYPLLLPIALIPLTLLAFPWAAPLAPMAGTGDVKLNSRWARFAPAPQSR